MQPNTDPVYLASQGLSADIYERFLKRIEIDPLTECWNWLGYCYAGYGFISKGNGKSQSIKVSRLIHILFYGPIPEGCEVLHKCPCGHNKRCANPEHLVADTHAENMRDERGDVWHSKHNVENMSRGERHYLSKLSAEQVQIILREYTGKRGQQAELARRFQVSKAAIWYIVNHRTRVHG